MSAMDKSLQDRLDLIQKEYIKKRRKLQKAERAARAKAHVQKVLQEQASLSTTELNQSSSASELNQSSSATELNQSSSATELNQSSSATELNQSSSATELNQSSGATELNQSSGATELNQSSGATELNQSSSATELNQSSSATELNQSSQRKEGVTCYDNKADTQHGAVILEQRQCSQVKHNKQETIENSVDSLRWKFGCHQTSAQPNVNPADLLLSEPELGSEAAQLKTVNGTHFKHCQMDIVCDSEDIFASQISSVSTGNHCTNISVGKEKHLVNFNSKVIALTVKDQTRCDGNESNNNANTLCDKLHLSPNNGRLLHQTWTPQVNTTQSETSETLVFDSETLVFDSGASKVSSTGSMKPDTDVNMKPDTDVNMKPDTYVNMKPDTDVNMKPDTDVNMKPDTYVNMKPDTDVNMKPVTDVKMKPKVGRKRKCASTGGVRCKSRIDAVSSGLDKTSQSLMCSPEFTTNRKPARGRLSTKRLMLTSIFQCLIDEGRRLGTTEDFCLSDKEEYQRLMCQKQAGLHGDGETVVVKEEGTDCTNDFNAEKRNNLHKRSCEIGCKKITESTHPPDSSNLKEILCSEKKDKCKTFDENISQTHTSKVSDSLCTHISDKGQVNLLSPEVNPDQLPVFVPMSPALFDSQHSGSSRSTNSRSNPSDAILYVPDSEGINDEMDRQHSNSGDTLTLELVSSFKIPRKEQLLMTVIGELQNSGTTELYIICLCYTSLKYFRLHHNLWACVHTEQFSYPLSKSWNAQLHLVADGEKIRVLLQKTVTDKTHFILYTFYRSDALDIADLDTLKSKSVCVCPVDRSSLVICQYADQKSKLVKYGLESPSQMLMEAVTDHITSLTTVQRLDNAVLGLATSGTLYIWNHCIGSLLISVDISDVCVQESLCCTAFSEQGFLFVVVLSRKQGKQAGSVLVVNPPMSTTETLYPLTAYRNKWSGSSDGQACLIKNGYLLGKENLGALTIWDVFTGQVVLRMKDTPVSCIASSGSFVTLTHKQCIHVYRQ